MKNIRFHDFFYSFQYKIKTTQNQWICMCAVKMTQPSGGNFKNSRKKIPILSLSLERKI